MSPSTPNGPSPTLELWNQWHSQPSHIRLIHVGAGAAGLLTAYKARRMLENYSLVCYERNPSIGGTWWENRYPGCACDIPSHVYTYSFEPNSQWSGFYAYSHEIQEYFERFYHKHELEPFVKLNTEVVSATWDDNQGRWDVELRYKDPASGKVEVFQDWCHVLVNGSGVLSKWKWPDIQGLHDFQGKLTHSAAWDPSTEVAGKRVAVIGTGSSSIQLVPHVAEKASQLTVFMRNVTWIAPQIASDEQAAAEDGEPPAAAGKHSYTRREKEHFRNDPEFHLKYRKNIEGQMAEHFPMFLRGTQLNGGAKEMMRAQMLQRIGPGHEELKEKLIPSWSPGCRRLTPGEGYLEALTRSNVTTVHEEIIKITPRGLVVAGGREIEVDVLACATGFEVAYVPHFKITGTGGVVMQEDWAEEPNIYLSVAAPKYPNYFVVNGPRGNWGQGCALPSHEVQIEYILQCVQKMQEEGIKSMEPKQKPTTDFNVHMDTWHSQNSVWAEDCKSWYKKNKPGGRVYLWGGSLLHHLKTLKKPRFEDYEFVYKSGDTFAYLGNGRTKLELNGTRQALAPWIRNEDTPWAIC